MEDLLHNSTAIDRSKKICVLVLILFSFGLYINTLYGEFIFDDRFLILESAIYRDIKNFPAFFTSASLPSLYHSFYRPTYNISFFIAYQLSGLESWGYHLVNIVLHSANTVILFFLSLSLFKPKIANKKTVILPFFTALVFACHPANVDAVAWVAGVGEMLVTFFFLTSFIYFIKKHYILSALLFLLSLMSKESALLLPFIFLLYDLCNEKLSLRCFRRYIPYITVAVLYMVLRTFALGLAVAPPSKGMISAKGFILNIAPVGFEIIKNLFYPFKLVYYPYMVFNQGHSLFDLQGMVFIVLAVIILLYLIVSRKRIAVIILAMVLLPLIIPVLALGWVKGNGPIYANRFLYLSTCGFSIFTALVFSRLFAFVTMETVPGQGTALKKKNTVRQIFILFLALFVLTVFSVQTITRNRVWQSELTLWADVINKTPEFTSARFYYALELSRRGKLDRALGVYKEILTMEEGSPVLFNNIGIIYVKKGEPAKAVAYFKDALRLDPSYEMAKRNLKRTLDLLRRQGDTR